MIDASAVPLFVVIPLAGAFVTALLARRVRGISDAIGVMASVGTFALAVLVAIKMKPGMPPLITDAGNWGTRSIAAAMGEISRVVGIRMVLDGLTSFMLVVVNFVGFIAAVYSISYMKRYTGKWQFFTLFLLMLAGMNGVLITGDMFNLFVFLEIASLASYALVAFGTGRRELEASFKYAIMGGVGSLLVLLGVIFLYSYTGTLNMGDMAQYVSAMGANGVEPIVYLVFALFLMGFGLKAALVPFHAWLPDAHPSAPAPISAMLSGVLIKALGVYTIMRIFYTVFGFPEQIGSVLMTLGAISMGIGGLVALRQWDMKRLLAYSSISQVGYIMLGIGIGTPLALLGALFHLFNHSVFKSLLFLDSGAVEYATGTRDMKEMGGLSKRMPITGATTMAGSMSLAGVPPFAGFWSKLIIILAAIEANHTGYAVWAVIMSIVTIAYVLKITRFAFLGQLKQRLEDIREVPAFMRISLAVLGLVCLLGGLLLLPGLKDGFIGKAVTVLLSGRGM